MRLLRFPGAVKRDPAIDAWLESRAGELGAIARPWYQRMRQCGDDVRELLHDGHPTACIGDAAFGYVNAFTAQGTGRYMRHVKLRPGTGIDEQALASLIRAAYARVKLAL